MGFKRTSEGRIFFQTPEGGESEVANSQQDNEPFENPFPSKIRPASALTGAQVQGSPQTQMQIITLLKTLNERLKLTQAERDKMAGEMETYRGMIEDLQTKSVRNEQAYKSLTQQVGKGGPNSSHAETLARDALEELEETRKLLLTLETKTNRADVGVKTLQKMQVEQAEKMAVSINHAAALTKRVKDTEAHQEQMGTKVDDALGQQARLSRKMDKAIEERVRFMRKLERIEETVLQTRDSLNAKAMVLLTDQGVAGQSDVDEAPAVSPAAIDADKRQSQNLQIAGVGGLVVAAVLGGWVLNAALNNDPSSVPVRIENTAQAPVASTETVGAPVDIAAMEWSVQDDTSSFAAQPPVRQTEDISDDIGTLDLDNQAQVEALLNNNPAALAAALNKIEPGNPLPETIIASQTAIAPNAGVETVPEAAAPVAAEPAPAPAPVVETTTKVATNAADPKALAKPDKALPDVVKEIEAQAFDGVPEAQHDLAAIYTAGHGGVKQNYDRAAFWFEQAASQGVANAAYNLGVLSHQGLGTDVNLENAIGWYNRAASLGHPEAQYNLGIAYIEGIGVSYDSEKAAGYFENAANNGIMEAAYNLGLIYENGLLGNAQPDQALAWYKSAADQGSPEAQQALEQLARSLGVSLDDVKDIVDDVKKPANSTGSATSLANIATAAGEPSGSPADAAATRAVTAQVQEYLIRSGLYPGPADGITGPLTEDAISSYQRAHNLQADGLASQALLSHMLANNITVNQ